MVNPILIIVATQLLFTTGDILARSNMPRFGFNMAAFTTTWFFAYFTIRTMAMFGQLYVFTLVELGKTMALFGATSIVLANALGLLLLKEVLSIGEYVGVALAVTAFLILAFY